MDDGFKIINSYFGIGGDDGNPQTSDNILFYIFINLFSVIMFFLSIFLYRNKMLNN